MVLAFDENNGRGRAAISRMPSMIALRVGSAFKTVVAATLLGCASGSALLAQEISVYPGGKNGVYDVGATATWSIETKGDSAVVTDLKYELKTGGLTVSRSGPLTLSEGKTSFTASFDHPGWLLLEVTGKNAAGQEIKAAGGALFSPRKIEPAIPPPADFDAFWKAKLEELAAVPMNPVLIEEKSGRDGVESWLVQLDNIRGSRIHGVLARPVKGGRLPALLIVQWAGVYTLDKDWALNRAAQGWLTLNIQAHDLPAIGPKSFYDDQFSGPLKNYWAIGNEDKETSYFLRMYLSCFRAADYLAIRPDWDGRVLVVTGGSQGGLQAILTAALHPKITGAVAVVPAGCDQSGPEVGRDPGWPKWYNEIAGKDPARVKTACRYYDIVNFASRVHCPVFVGVGLIDITCPAPGVFAGANRLAGPTEIMVMPLGDHQRQHQDGDARAEAWLTALQAGRHPEAK